MPSRKPTQELADEELLLELPVLRPSTDGATHIEVGGDIVKSAENAPGMLPKAPTASSNANISKILRVGVGL